jgi:hypothetical protein
MKKIILFLIIITTICSITPAQSLLSEINKVRKIRLLDSNLKDVRKLLGENDEREKENYWQFFSSENSGIRVEFSTGDCSDESEYWNVPEWTVTKIVVTPDDDIKVKNFKFDFSGFVKRIADKEFPKEYILYNKDLGIIFEINDEEISKIIFYPTENKIGFLCSNEETLEVISTKKPLFEFIYETEPVCILRNMPAVIDKVSLSTSEILFNSKNENKKISVDVSATDAENDVLTYIYKVSGGKIIGQGSRVLWDLSDVKPGTYTITAGIDDGAGIKSEMTTKTVVIKECPDCSRK